MMPRVVRFNQIWKHVIAVFLVALVVIGAMVLWSRPSRYARFMHQPPEYYVQLAQACDALRREHPAGTNPPPVQLSGRDPGLSPILRQLNADEIRLYPNRVWIGMGNDRNSFAILWEPDTSRSNAWVLMADYDGFLNKVYTEIRP